jgi:hypothetical protein
MAQNSDEAAAALEQAIASGEAELTDSSPEEKGTDKEADKEAASQDNIPYSRFKEVNDRMKGAETEVESLQKQLQESTTSLNRMTEMLNSHQEAVDLVERIKGLKDDPEAGPHVHAIDRALRGIKEEVESGDKTPEQGLKEAQKLVEDTREELAEQLAETQVQQLWDRADVLADKLFAQLPKEYTEQDISIIQELLPVKVDWERIGENPETLKEELSESFQKVIDAYGTPRGALLDPKEVEFVDEKKETEEAFDPKQVLKELEEQEWGAVEEKDGKKDPIFSDADFTEALAERMRLMKAEG